MRLTHRIGRLRRRAVRRLRATRREVPDDPYLRALRAAERQRQRAIRRRLTRTADGVLVVTGDEPGAERVRECGR